MRYFFLILLSFSIVAEPANPPKKERSWGIWDWAGVAGFSIVFMNLGRVFKQAKPGDNEVVRSREEPIETVNAPSEPQTPVVRPAFCRNGGKRDLTKLVSSFVASPVDPQLAEIKEVISTYNRGRRKGEDILGPTLRSFDQIYLNLKGPVSDAVQCELHSVVGILNGALKTSLDRDTRDHVTSLKARFEALLKS